jgi:hypothetical protein
MSATQQQDDIYELLANAFSSISVIAEDRGATEADVDRETFLKTRTGKPLRPNQMAFTQNFPKWNTSLMKAYYGAAATQDNDFCYDWLPKRDTGYDVLYQRNGDFVTMHCVRCKNLVVATGRFSDSTIAHPFEKHAIRTEGGVRIVADRDAGAHRLRPGLAEGRRGGSA